MSNNEQTIRVITVDDHEIMRGGIRFLLLAIDGVELVGEAKRGDEALAVCRESAPNVVLMDMKMPGMDGIETTAAIKRDCPDVKVLILTSFHDHKLVRRAMQAGAVGYLLKDASKEELENAIHAAVAGQTTIAAAAAESLLAEPSPEPIELTERERAVLRLLARGMSNKEIGRELHRSPFTVRHHVSQLIRKFDAANRAELAAMAVERGLVN